MTFDDTAPGPAGRVRTITITGTRSIGEATATTLDSLFDRYLRPFARPDVQFFVGGALGIDTAALNYLAEHTNAAVTVAVPCTVDAQPGPAAEAIVRWREQGRLTQVVEIGAPALGAPAYHSRNRWMVDRSEFVIGFPHGNEDASGTWYTLHHAARQGKPRLVVPLQPVTGDLLNAL